MYLPAVAVLADVAGINDVIVVTAATEINDKQP